MPSALIPAMTEVMAWAAAARAALTEGFVRVTPTFTRATSGTTVILPVAETVIVWRFVVSVVVGAPETGPVRTERAAMATMAAPSASAPRVRIGCVM